MKTTFDFGNGEVAAHQHPKGGGWVADTATVDDTVCVSDESVIYGNAKVHGHVYLYGKCVIKEEATVSGNAHLHDSTVSGNAIVSGSSTIYSSHVGGFSVIDGYTEIRSTVIDAEIHDRVEVLSPVIGGKIYGHKTKIQEMVYGDVIVRETPMYIIGSDQTKFWSADCEDGKRRILSDSYHYHTKEEFISSCERLKIHHPKLYYESMKIAEFLFK